MDELLYKYDDEIKPMIFDIIRLLTMQIITQFLISMNNSASSSFFTREFIQITLFLVLSLMVFWMIVYKFLKKNETIEKYEKYLK
jgi:hypothetical protein